MHNHFPLLQSQLGVFHDWEAHPKSLRYNLPSMVRYEKPAVDAVRLQRALQLIVEQRQVLHTRFLLDEEGRPRQFSDENMAIPVVMRPMTEAEAKDYIENSFVRPFDLLSGQPLCRFEIIETQESVFLLIDFHHSIADGLTIAQNLMGRDLPDAYEGRPLTEDNTELYLQAEREQQAFGSEAYQHAAEYHRQHFAEVAFTHPPISSYTPFQSFTLAAIPAAQNATVSQLLFLSAFALALSKHSHSLQVAFSVLIHGRTGRRMREAYGMFVQSLPLSINIDNSLTVSDFMTTVRQELTAALRHRIYPIGHVYRDLKKRPALVFGFQGGQIAENVCLDGHQVQGIQLHQEDTLDDSCLVYATEKGQYEVRGIMAKAVAECARNMALHPEALLTDISMMTKEEEAEMYQLAQGPRMAYNEGETVVDMILRQARNTPERTAIVDENGSITYGELDRMSAEVAQTVSQPIVPVPTKRSLQFVVTAIGVMRAGAAYLPIDEEWPRGYSSRRCEGTPEISLAPAYMIYTSGTTGKPKGVMIPHRALTNLVHFIVKEWGITSESRIACHSSFAFDASVEDIFPVLTVGGTLFIPNETERHDLRLMYQFLERHHITGGCYTTQFGTMLAQHYPLHVDYLCLGGEKLHPFTPCIDQPPSGSESDCITVAPPPYRIFNTYGPTEFTVDATFYELKPGRNYQDIPIGRPLPNCAAYVVDPQGRLVPRGVKGELLLAGRQLATNVATSPHPSSLIPHPSSLIPHPSSLIPHPSSLIPHPSSLIPHPTYPTGDLVRWNNDGELEYIGRKDRLLKYRGYRINPAEIEQALTTIPDIETAAVRLETTHLVAYYQAPHPIDSTLLRRQLTTQLPAYMLPSRFIHLTSLPFDSHGKTDWPHLRPNTNHIPKPSTGPRMSLNHSDSPLLPALSSLFARILQLDEVQPDDDFFDLGGTSLDAMLLVEELRQQGCVIHYGDIFRCPTPRMLEQLLIPTRETHSHPLPEEGEFDMTQDSFDAPSGGEAGWVDCLGVVLSGATGFLGCHVLHELLTTHHEISTIVCIVRGSSMREARERLQSAYQHYFADSLFNSTKRIVIVNGDITDSQTFCRLDSLFANNASPFFLHPSSKSCFIHCAADVRFFAPHQEIERTNIEGTRLVADFCLRNNIRLTHISTLSVLHADGLHSPYITSKKEAEAYVTRLTGQRLQAQIVRLGFLAPRSTDGVFQRNADQSFFFSLLRLFGLLRAYPASLAHLKPDVMPVDQAASAITGHALHPDTGNICINLTQPTPWKSLLAQATEMADDRFYELLYQHNDTPFATSPSIDRNTICRILQSYIDNLR